MIERKAIWKRERNYGFVQEKEEKTRVTIVY